MEKYKEREKRKQQTYGVNRKKAVLRRKFIAIQSYLKTRNISNKQPKLTPKAIRERRTTTKKTHNQRY